MATLFHRLKLHTNSLILKLSLYLCCSHLRNVQIQWEPPSNTQLPLGEPFGSTASPPQTKPGRNMSGHMAQFAGDVGLMSTPVLDV
jgi:hypothetical protein